MNRFKKFMRNILNLNDKNVPVSRDDLNDTYLIDIRGPYFNMGGVSAGDVDEGNSQVQTMKVKPIDVLKELERIPSRISLVGLDKKIEILKDKADLISEYYAKIEIQELINFLKARKRLDEGINKKSKTTFGEWFSQFDYTNLEKVEALTKKYRLRFDKADIFVAEFPDEAVETMKEYTKHVLQLTGKKPIFYVIATEDSFQKSYERRDPILLAQSPFGMFLNILGAWDKEMIYLPEL